MLAESLSPSMAAANYPAPNIEMAEVGIAWLTFVALGGLCFLAIPFVVWLIRRQLPETRRAKVRLEPVTFGGSPKSLHSQRHVVRQHRTLMTAVLISVLALLILPGLVALRSLGVSALQVAIGFVLPTLVVALHARQRESSR